jgi:hypothetical protein
MTAKRRLREKWKAQVTELRAAAKGLPPGREREEKLRLALQLEKAAGMHVAGWLTSPGLQAPRQS